MMSGQQMENTKPEQQVQGAQGGPSEDNHASTAPTDGDTNQQDEAPRNRCHPNENPEQVNEAPRQSRPQNPIPDLGEEFREYVVGGEAAAERRFGAARPLSVQGSMYQGQAKAFCTDNSVAGWASYKAWIDERWDELPDGGQLALTIIHAESLRHSSTIPSASFRPGNPAGSKLPDKNGGPPKGKGYKGKKPRNKDHDRGRQGQGQAREESRGRHRLRGNTSGRSRFEDRSYYSPRQRSHSRRRDEDRHRSRNRHRDRSPDRHGSRRREHERSHSHDRYYSSRRRSQSPRRRSQSPRRRSRSPRRYSRSPRRQGRYSPRQSRSRHHQSRSPRRSYDDRRRSHRYY